MGRGWWSRWATASSRPRQLEAAPDVPLGADPEIVLNIVLAGVRFRFYRSGAVGRSRRWMGRPSAIRSAGEIFGLGGPSPLYVIFHRAFIAPDARDSLKDCCIHERWPDGRTCATTRPSPPCAARRRSRGRPGARRRRTNAESFMRPSGGCGGNRTDPAWGRPAGRRWRGA